MKTKDIHKKYSLIFLFSIMALFMLATGASAETVISISPEKLQIDENGAFTLEITITSDLAITGTELQLSYDPELISVTGISEGSFLKQGDGSTIFSKGDIDNEQGIVTNVYGVIMGKETILEPGTFASIEFSAGDVAGISEIELNNVIVSNSAGASLPVEINNGKVLIGDVREDLPDVAAESPDEAESAGQNSLLISAFAIVCLTLLFIRK
ncbi:cohesin domain-containing protein [Methanolobus sp. ZRKC3]|uniref:cohesin domain-containing protein n=1 Tax=Methanolobus sp. ZRKC3 TaxID=3125786 RepID=UPI003247519A